ncbi:LuxR family transcriptional regulator [Rhizobium helianthi]|uniref:LuxR family transcriptional regulator n=1 Tax=Rhizobium helianthi TaxID=1132695 RepID=A0ABW4M303_9HYPH
MDIDQRQLAETPIARWLDELAALETQFDIFRFMRRLAEGYGNRAFLIAQLPDPATLELSGKTIITNWPSELLTLFDKAQLLHTSPLVRKLRDTTIPFTFSMDQIAAERGDDTSKRLFERFGLTNSAIFPVHDDSGRRGCVSFSGDKAEFTLTEMMELSFLSIHIFQRLAGIRQRDEKTGGDLVEREISCLIWTAAGKTSAEIAEILQLSEHTVNHYLNRATKKLDAVNRTQTVAKALRLGLIK